MEDGKYPEKHGDRLDEVAADDAEMVFVEFADLSVVLLEAEKVVEAKQQTCLKGNFIHVMYGVNELRGGEEYCCKVEAGGFYLGTNESQNLIADV